MAELRIIVEPDPLRPERILLTAEGIHGVEAMAPGVARTRIDIEAAWIALLGDKVTEWVIRNGVRQREAS